jgi:hypothetical protein
MGQRSLAVKLRQLRIAVNYVGFRNVSFVSWHAIDVRGMTFGDDLVYSKVTY